MSWTVLVFGDDEEASTDANTNNNMTLILSCGRTPMVLGDADETSTDANASADHKMTHILFCGRTLHAFTVFDFGDDDEANADADAHDNKTTCILFCGRTQTLLLLWF